MPDTIKPFRIRGLTVPVLTGAPRLTFGYSTVRQRQRDESYAACGRSERCASGRAAGASGAPTTG